MPLHFILKASDYSQRETNRFIGQSDLFIADPIGASNHGNVADSNGL